MLGLWSKYGYGSIPINTIFSGMNIHLPAILMFTRGTRFWHTAILEPPSFWATSNGLGSVMSDTFFVAWGTTRTGNENIILLRWVHFLVLNSHRNLCNPAELLPFVSTSSDCYCSRLLLLKPWWWKPDLWLDECFFLEYLASKVINPKINLRFWVFLYIEIQF